MANQNTIITIGFDYNLTKAYGDLEKARQKLEAKVKPLNLDLGGKNITNMNKSLKETNSILGEIGGSLGHNVSKMAEWAISGTLLYGSLRKLREISEIVYDVDDAMRQVRGVTGMTANDTDMLVTKYQKLADELNSTVSAMSEMSLEMYRQGLTAEETASRMATITKLAGIENLDVGAVTEYVTAGVNSFERLGLSAEEYGDKVAKAAAVSATSVDEIAKGLQRSSNIASVTGLSFSELISYISTISSVSRLSASTIGNSMKGVLSRFSKITEMGEDNTIVYGQVRDAVKSVGIAFEDTNGRMRPVSDIFKEIAAGWKDMDKEQQTYLANTLGGTYHVDKVLTLFNNWDMQMKIHSDVMNSAGEVDRQYSEKVESMRGHIDALKNAFEDLAINTLDSDVAKSFIDLVTLFVKTIDSVGILNIAIFALSASFVSLTKSISVTSIASFASGLVEIYMSMGKATVMTKEATIAMAGLTKATQLLSLALKTVAVFAIVSAVVGLVQAHKQYEEQLKSTKEAQEQFDSAVKTSNENLDTASVEAMTQAIEKMKQALEVEDAVEELRKLSQELENVKKYGDDDEVQSGVVAEYEERIKALQNIVNMEKQAKKAKEDLELADVGATEASMKSTASKILETQETINQINANKKLAETDKTLISQYPQFVKVLNEKTGAVGLDTEALLTYLEHSKNVASTELDSLKTRAQAQIEYTNSQIEQTNARILAVNAEIEAYKKLAQIAASTSESEYSRAMAGMATGRIEGTEESRGKALVALSAQKEALEASRTSLNAILNMSAADLVKSKGGPSALTVKEPGGSKSSKKNILDQFDDYKDKIEDVNHALTILSSKESIAITDPDKIKILTEQNEKYNELQQRVHEYANALREEQKGYAENSAEYRELQEEIQKQSEAWWANEAAIEANINKIHEMAREAIKKQLLPELEAISKILERTQKDFESSVDKRIDSYEAELDALKKKQKALEQEEERLKIIKDLEEARLKLRNIQNEKNVQLYTGQGATGWEWVADPAQLESAGEAVADLEEKLREFDLDATRQAEQDKLQAKIDALEAQKQAEQQKYNERKQKFDDFENYVKSQMEANDDIKLENLNDFLSSLTEDERESYATRIEELRKFVASWNEQVASMRMIGATGGGSYGSGGSSSGSKTVLVGPDGNAPPGLSAGDRVMTGGGTYRIDKVKSDGSYESTKVDNQKASQPKGKAVGGPVSAGQTYEVNELGLEAMMTKRNGRDYLTPLTSGKILTASQTKSALAGVGGGDTVININNLSLPGVKNVNDFMEEMSTRFKTYSRNR